jgi:hypothetical protein
MRNAARTILAILSTAATLVAIPAHAAPTIVGGDCWRSGTPLWCRGTWSPGGYLRIYAIDHFSDARPAWRTAFTTSNQRWTAAAGPQTIQTYRRDHDSWVFYEDSSTGFDGLTARARAITWSCDYASYCSRYFEPMMVKFSSIKLNKNLIANDSGTATLNTFLHETGHTLGLAHHPSSTDLMYNAANAVTAPTADNAGAQPPCTGSSTTSNASNRHAGVRCVYDWTI